MVSIPGNFFLLLNAMARKIILTLFSLFWFFIIFTEYLFQHRWYADAARNFQYYGFLIPLLIGIGGFAWLRHKEKGRIASYRALNGLGLFGLSFLIVLTTTAIFFSKYDGLDFNLAGASTFGTYYIGVSLAVYVCVGYAYLLGDLLLILFPMKMATRELFVVKIALGIMFLVALLFLLGTFHLLHPFLLLPLFLLLALFNLNGGKDFVQHTLLKPISLPPDLNLIGIASFAVLLTFVTLNFTQNIRPIPIGYDAMTLYMRIPSLIRDYTGLIQGHGMYNWSLFMSLGFVLFNSTAVTLELSFIGGPLALFSLYALSRRLMNTNLALLTCAIFYTMPEVNFLSYQDTKIDLGLLFILICAVLLLVNWINPYQEAKPDKNELEGTKHEPQARNTKPTSSKKRKNKVLTRKKKVQKKKQTIAVILQSNAFLLRLRDTLHRKTPKVLEGQHLMVWLGLLTGFAMGIKVTSLLLLLCVLTVIWYVKGNAISTLGVLFMCLFGILLFRLDEQSGMRDWHANVSYLQWLLAGCGLSLLGWEAIKKRKLFLDNIKRSLILIAFSLIAISPWFIKNISETKQLNIDALLNGQKAIPQFKDISMETLEQNWKNNEAH
jgi:hypothetical protein